ncbi:MAG: class I SAM-dependent methyltransferase [Clostridium sp.]|nr:class I SAM-dependent methyltransferase [Clostridium sp.]
MKDWTNYQNETYGDNVCKLLNEFLDNYKIDNAIDLGCGSGNETVYMIKNGIKVLAIDRQLNQDFILNRLSDSEKQLISFKESSFEDVELPKTKLLTAFFSIPFCNPNNFDELWTKIYNSIEDNGYFVGQLFGDRDAWNVVESINTFSIDKVKEYLKNYNIIKLEEIEYVRENDNKKWHFYDIIAQKKEGDNHE